MPPSALTFLKYASIALPIVPYAEAGPEYGLMPPIVISLSVAPLSYFFCATAGAPISAALMPARARERNLRFIRACLQQGGTMPVRPREPTVRKGLPWGWNA